MSAGFLFQLWYKPVLIHCFPCLINRLGFFSPRTMSYQLSFPQSLEQCAWHTVKVQILVINPNRALNKWGPEMVVLFVLELNKPVKSAHFGKLNIHNCSHHVHPRWGISFNHLYTRKHTSFFAFWEEIRFGLGTFMEKEMHRAYSIIYIRQWKEQALSEISLLLIKFLGY